MAERPLWVLDDGRSMGGGQHFALRLLRSARADGRAVRLIAPEGTRVLDVARAEGIETAALDFPAPADVGRVLMTCLRLRKLLRTAQPDALIVGNSARCQLVAAGAARQRVICLMHEQDTAARRIARLLSYAGPVVATGANAAAAYATRLGRPVAKIDNMLAPSEMDVLIAGRTARSGEGPPVLGVLGRLIPEKGIRELVEELAQCPDAWERLIVGAPRQEGEYADEVERRIDELGLGSRARLEGEVSDVPTFLAGIDILVLPSTGREGQPTVILEALACARPVVVRQPVFSADYEGLPVVPYRGAADLPQALGRARGLPPADSDALRLRFTPQAVLEVLESIAP